MTRKAVPRGAILLVAVLSATAGAQKKEETPPEWGKRFDWQTWASVLTLPALQDSQLLTDGDIATTPQLTRGGEAGSEITIKFPKMVDVTMFRFAYAPGGSGADKYRIMADMEGQGVFSERIAARKDEKMIKGQWIEIPVNRKVFGLKYIAEAGQIGFRASFPNLSEIEIYSTENIRTGLPGVPGGPAVRTGAFKALPELTKRDIDIRICTDAWNYNLAGWDKEKPALGQWPGYRNLVNSLKELDANSVRFFDETLCGEKSRLPFPSKLVEPEYSLDWLKPLSAALKQDGYKLYYFTHAWKPPFQRRGKMAKMPWCRWDYPYHQSDTIVGVSPEYSETYPCVICEDDFRVKWTQMMREALQNGASGVYLMPDEYFFKGHNLARANCPACTREFKNMFGYDSMPKPAVALKANEGGFVGAPPAMDTEQYRKWKLFEYLKVSELFKRVSADLRKEFPQAQFINNDNQGAFEASLGRLEHTVASDIIGTDPNANFAQVYGQAHLDTTARHVAFTKRFEASAGKHKLLSSCGWGSANMNAPLSTIGGIVAEVMLGARIVEVYRQNYMYMNDGVPVYKRAFRMVRLLERWGIDQASVPEVACMLFSRAGEDWYYTKVSSMMSPDKKGAAVDFYLHLADESINKIIATASEDDRERFLAQDRMRGFGSRMTMESLLCSGGVPYKVAYTERPDNMKNLQRFKLLIMPFAYSLSQAALNEIKAAVDAGTRLVIFEQLAPTDEFGTNHEKPLLQELVGKPGVTFIKESLADVSADRKKLNEYKRLINKAIAETGYVFEGQGKPVSYVVDVMPGDKGYILYLGNMIATGAALTSVIVGLPGTGDYRMETYNSRSHEINVNMIDGKELIPAETLKRFSVEVAPQEAKLIRIYR